jgi:succinoglycan biosynthesis protein ExoM
MAFVQAPDLLYTAVQVPNRETCGKMRATGPLVAVCVCTRARPHMLRRCLASLRAQRLETARLRMRLVVVDNNPEPAARPIYDEIWGAELPGEIVHCPRPGIPMARNAALDAALRAGAAYIAFLDDDEVAPPQWLSRLLAALEESGADAVQGGVRDLPADARDIAAGGPLPERELAWERCESLATCNVLFRARLIEPPLSLRFDESMQFTGGSDREFFMRAHKRRAKLARVDGIDVLEDVHEDRGFAYRAARTFAAGSNYFARVCKNEPGLVAAARIAVRAVDRSASGVAKLAVAAALLLALRPYAAHAQWRKGCLSLCFAAGCLTPLVGVRAYPYRTIQGA